MNSHTTRNFGIVIVVLLLLMAMFVAVALQPAPGGDRLVYLPGASVQNASQEEWLARHWQWTLSMPARNNPGQDVSGKSCANGQSGPVFFIPRNFAPCTVSAGKSILIPIAGGECSTSEPAPFSGTSEAELRACAASEAERYTNITVQVDGEVLPSINAYRTTSPLFTMNLPEDNVLGAPAGPAYAVADGYQVILKPLSPGEHDIVVHLELVDGTVLPDKLVNITVVEPMWQVQRSTPVFTVPLATPVSATPIPADGGS